MSEVKAFDPYISTTVVGTAAAMAERKLGGFIQRCDYDKLTEQNKMLREALELIVKIAGHPPVDKLILKEANQALEATK